MPKPKARYGNPNNQSATAFRGVSSETLRTKRLARKASAGQIDADRLVSYDPASVLSAIKACLCPFCGAGPYKSLPNHVSALHGVDAKTLRKLAGVGTSESLISPELSARRRKILEGRPDWSEMRKQGTAQATANGAHRKATDARVSDRRKQDIEIVRLYNAGYLLRDIALKLEIGTQGVKAALSRSGIEVDMRTRRGVVDPADWGAKARRLPLESHVELLRLYENGMRQAEIGDRFGISQTRVGQILRENGIRRHARGKAAADG